MSIPMAVNVEWWNQYFAEQAKSIGLAEEEAERVLVRGPYSEIGERFSNLLSEISRTNPERHKEILRLLAEKLEEFRRPNQT